MDPSFSLTNVVAAAITFFTLLGTIFFFLNKKSRSHQENKTLASSSSSPSSLPLNGNHHVFPSFHGADVRVGPLSHILEKFISKGISPFVDNDIERGMSIGPVLTGAIRGSRIALVLLSERYASSTWCLNELVEIIECRDKLTVVALFYKVDPTHVKKQTGDFGKVFRKTCKGKTKEDIRRWEDALKEVAQIAGYHSGNWNNEAKMVKTIVTDVSNKLNNSSPSSDFEGLVGMESHMTKMEPLLRLDSDEVRVLGIWGAPGIGKTTIARSLFKRHSGDFQLSLFMDNIKRKYAKPAWSDDYSVKLYLQEQFMSQLTSEIGFKVPHLGIVKDRLKDKKVLAVLDDVDQFVQLEAMAKETCWFGRGSRIIITTQDQKLLKASGINDIYKVDLPSSDEALEMFCMYAFGQKDPEAGFMELASEVTRVVGKLPLGLRIMGSYFRGLSKSKQEWTKALRRLTIRLDGDIESILMFSYDALSVDDKNLFLHIACFFNDESVDTVEGCLADSFSEVTLGLHVLAEKSLIDIDSGVIKMHGLLVQLGREIVKQSYKEPGKRQFLVDAKDIEEVLSGDKADTSSVIGIDLRFSYDIEEDITCTSERAFERLSNLRFLRVNNLRFLRDDKLHFLRVDDGPNLGSLNSISRKLRFLSWKGFGMPCLPSSFHPKFLVKLDMSYSKLEKLWDEIQPLNNLKWMDLSYSYSLKQLIDLSTAVNLHNLNLSHCSSLVEFPSSFTDLEYLDISNCSSLVELPSSIGNTFNLEKLYLSHCSSLVELPSSIGNAVNHQYLDLSHCSNLVELPSSIGNAVNLQILNLSHCSSLVELPSTIGNAVNLQYLDLSHCSNLVKLPSSIRNAVNLLNLNLSHCSSLVELPSSIGNAVNLRNLYLSHCSSLVELPSSIENAVNLQYLNLSHCSSLVELPSSIGNAVNLRNLNLSHCSSLVELPSSIGNAVNLQNLNLSHCSSLVELPSSIGNAVNLKELYLDHCSNMVELPSSMKNLCKLWDLKLEECSKLEVNLANINLESLQELDLSYCYLLKSYRESSTNIEDFRKLSGAAIKEAPWEMSNCGIQELGPWIGRRSRLRRLVLRVMEKQVSLPQLPYSVVELDADNCESLERLDCFFLNPDIRHLSFINCFKLNQEARDLIIQTPTNEYAALPGGEVPVCFPYRSSGSSVTVKLNQMHLGTSTKFKACIIFADEEDEDKNEQWGSVYCSITSKQNALGEFCKTIDSSFEKHLYIFEDEAVEVASTELAFEFRFIPWENRYLPREIKECGVLQLLASC